MFGPWPTALAIKGAKIAARPIITMAARRGDGDLVVAEARQHQLGRSPADDYVPARGAEDGPGVMLEGDPPRSPGSTTTLLLTLSPRLPAGNGRRSCD